MTSLRSWTATGGATGVATLLQPRLPHGLHCTAVQFQSTCALFCCIAFPAPPPPPHLNRAGVGCWRGTMHEDPDLTFQLHCNQRKDFAAAPLAQCSLNQVMVPHP